MQVVGRNEPCPCGSGKKYKKCHANQQMVSIQDILITEQMDQQLQFLNERMVPEQGTYREDLTYAVETLSKSFEEPQFLTVFLTFMFGLRKSDEATHWSAFLHDRQETTERPRMRDLMESWHEPRPVIGEVIYMEESTREIVLKDLTDGAEYTVILPEFHQWAPIDYLFAVLLPFENKWIPYGFMFPAVYTKEDRTAIINQISKLGIEAMDRSKWLETNTLVELIRTLVERSSSENEENWLEAMTESVEKTDQSETIKKLKTFWDDRGDENLALFACHLAASYFAEHGSRIRKPQTYAAAITYLMGQHATDEISQKEAGEAFDMPAASVSSTVRKIDAWFQRELKALQDQSEAE
ncbi:hypothetical protein KP78_14170 [Jeotgalibacillus soli]|uniref:Uncharacterized protein n=2 Tax=Jeotgalibacillus soli TaxID=889306 RepID=A0A0C2S7F4_9BACL|nr:hypothetical protein KP78_14170 [Jeotgalibacillus soli]